MKYLAHINAKHDEQLLKEHLKNNYGKRNIYDNYKKAVFAGE